MGPELSAFLDLVSRGGAVLAPVFAYLWWMERRDNREGAQRDRDLLDRTLKALHDTAGSLGDLRVYLGLSRNDGERRG